MDEQLHKQETDTTMPEINVAPRPLKQKTKKRPIIILIAGGVLLTILLLWWFVVRQPASPEPESQPAATTAPQQEPVTVAEEEPEFDETAIKKALKDWDNSVSGITAVTITDKEGNVLAEINGDKQFFTASIYKLYVAYIGYQKIDDGTYKADEPYLGSWTRGKCLDEMIRTSHSPCAEKMWVELGKENLTAKLKTYGLKETSMTGLTTSSSDAAIILSRLESGKGISDSSRAKMMDSMLEQIYQDTLQTGFKKADVYSKIGFNGDLEYHDTAIVHLQDGRSLVVSVLTSSVGTKNIARLGAELETVLD